MGDITKFRGDICPRCHDSVGPQVVYSRHTLWCSCRAICMLNSGDVYVDVDDLEYI